MATQPARWTSSRDVRILPVCLALNLLLATDCAREPVGFAVATAATAGGEDGRVVLAAVGDLHFGRYDFRTSHFTPVSAVPYPLGQVQSVLSRAHVTFANLETPILTEPAGFRPRFHPTFRADPETARLLARAGVDVVSLANNHILDFGTAGVAATRSHLVEAGLIPLGAGRSVEEASRPVVIRAGGMRVAFISLTEWSNRDPISDRLCCVGLFARDEFAQRGPELVSDARRSTGADFVVVSAHWGAENQPHPEGEIREIAHALVDAGADVVLGHHPHWVQDMEYYRHAFIAYSLGNFLFDNAKIEARLTVVLELTLELQRGVRRVGNATLYPAIIDAKTHVPQWAHGGLREIWSTTLAELAPAAKIATLSLDEE